MAGDFPWDRNLTNAVTRILRDLRGMELVTIGNDPGPQFCKGGPTYRLTEAGRDALAGR